MSRLCSATRSSIAVVRQENSCVVYNKTWTKYAVPRQLEDRILELNIRKRQRQRNFSIVFIFCYMRRKRLKVKCDHRSKFSNLSNWKEEAWKNQGFNGIRTRDLNKLTSLPMCGLIAQLVEHRTGIAEVTGSNPVEALIFSGFFFPIA